MSSNGESIVAEATELDTNEVEAVASEGGDELSTPTLPSDEVEFQVPEKFEGKSLEDVIKSYQELEKMNQKGGDEEVSQEEAPVKEEAQGEEQFQKYANSLEANGELSEAEYTELAELGFDKAAVDAEIGNRAERKEFEAYKADKNLSTFLEPLGGGTEKFKEVVEWANGNKSKEELAEFNHALKGAPQMAQKALIRELYAEYESGEQTQRDVLHTNAPQTSPSKGYNTQEEFFKDVGSTEYKTNPAYRAAVEKKMSQSRDDLFS